MFKKLITRQASIVTTMALILSVITPFAGIANAGYPPYSLDGGGNYLCQGDYNPQGGATGWFYRTTAGEDARAADSENTNFTYGYGYGYAAGSYQFGYGYGYGFGYFCSNNRSFSGQPSRYGFFLGASAGLSETFTVGVTTDGDTAVSTPLPIALNVGLGDYKVNLPEGLILTGPSTWNGNIEVSGSNTGAGLTNTGLASGDVVSISLGGASDSDTISFNKAVIVQIPHTLANGDVVKINSAGSSSTLSACTESQFTGSSSTVEDLTNSDNYPLSSGEACYVYSSGIVYVATMHFTDFAAGAASSGDSGDSYIPPQSGGSGGGTSHSVKKVATATKTVAEAKSIRDFADLTNIEATDWEYPIITQMMELGLLKGSVNGNNERIFNMYGNMNRAESAALIARYMGYDDTTKITTAPFADVPAGDWYASSVAYLKSKGVVSGKTLMLFAPAEQISRAEFFKMMVEAYLNLHPEFKTAWDNLMTSGTQPFSDVSSKHWAYKYMRLAAAKSLLNGYTEKGKRMMKPDKSIFRIEGGAMISNILNLK